MARRSKPTHLARADIPGHLKAPVENEQFIPITPELIKQADLNERRLPGVDGEPGMKVEEAIVSAASWWDNLGRFMVPDAMKKESERVVPSPILNGVQWDLLDKRSRLRIVKIWYAHKGIETVLGGKQE